MKAKHPHTCDKRNTQEYKIIDSIHNTMMTDRKKGTVGGKSNSEVRTAHSEKVPRKDVGKSGTEHL